MAQKVLPYKYEIKDEKTGLTAIGGLSTYLDLASASGLMKSIERNLKVRRGGQGWTDQQVANRTQLMGQAARGLVDLPGVERLADRIELSFHELRRIGPDLRLTLRPSVD